MPEEQAEGTTEAQREPDDATHEATVVAGDQPAVYTTAFLVEVENPGLFRMTFGEGTAGKRRRIRFALVMPTADVRELVRILNSLLSKLDAEQAADKTQSPAR